MGAQFLIDTNTLIDFQTRIIPKKGFDYVANIIDEDFTISFISYIEFIGYKNASTAMEDFVSLANVLETNKLIIDKTVQLRKSYRIKLPDAIIAATAIVKNLTLITRNTKDFINIKDLKTANPYDIS